MKRNFMVRFILFLFLFAPVFNIVCMEKNSGEKHRIDTLSTLLGYSVKEVKNNKNKKSEYLEKLQLLASVSLAQSYLHEKVAIINKTTDQLLESLKDFYFRAGFEYTDRPCHVQQIASGSQVMFHDGNKETKIVEDIFVLTTSEAKAAYLQAQNLLRTKSLHINDRSDQILANPKVKFINKTHNRLNPFIEILLKSDNHELAALGKWLRVTVAHEQQMTAIGAINALLINIVFQHNPLAKKPNLEELAKFGEKIKEHVHDLSPVITKYYPAFYELLDVGGKLLNLVKEYENSDELPSYDRYEGMRLLFRDTYNLANATYESNNTFYGALKQELDLFLQDKFCKNRLELMKKYSHPLYRFPGLQLSLFPETLKGTEGVLKNNVVATTIEDEWTISAIKASNLKRKKTVQLAQQSNQRKRVAQKKAQQKKALLVHVVKEGEKEATCEKELPLNKNSNQHTTSQKLPHVSYDSRVLRWRDPAFLSERNPDERSLLYHTLPFVVNQINKQYGVQVKQANRTHVGKFDTVYYTGGEIHYKKGERAGQRETVLFALCEDDAGIAYHVGWNAKENSLFKEFETNEFNYQFPPLYNEPTFEKKTIVVDVNDEQFKTTYRENQFCFEIDDQRNGAAIILYKPSYA